MAQLPCIGLSWLLTKPPFGSCAIYFHHSVTITSMDIMDIPVGLLDKESSHGSTKPASSGSSNSTSLVPWLHGHHIETVHGPGEQKVTANPSKNFLKDPQPKKSLSLKLFFTPLQSWPGPKRKESVFQTLHFQRKC